MVRLIWLPIIEAFEEVIVTDVSCLARAGLSLPHSWTTRIGLLLPDENAVEGGAMYASSFDGAGI
jgi:hypothetical protein